MSDPVRIEVELDGAKHAIEAHPGQLLIEAMEDAGLQPPYSCRAGACAACMCQLVEGEVELLNNAVLNDDELAERWILACQAVPTTPFLRVRYP